MYWFPVKIAISALMIAFASWLADKRPDLAGFIIALLALGYFLQTYIMRQIT